MIRVIIVGLIAGWLAGKLMRGYGYGAVADILLGLVGGIIGSILFGVVRTACVSCDRIDHWSRPSARCCWLRPRG